MPHVARPPLDLNDEVAHVQAICQIEHASLAPDRLGLVVELRASVQEVQNLGQVVAAPLVSSVLAATPLEGQTRPHVVLQMDDGHLLQYGRELNRQSFQLVAIENGKEVDRKC
ncbi:hypothetical protein EON64_02070 [archaeon]|nr:MAG: hypothetical protein EON64_02070 [archaeon]